MQKNLVGSIALIVGLIARSYAQDEASIRRYIEQYKLLAMSEQKRSGIPAAITLAQGIHETVAGSSELATQANNHFGIKCKKDWTGETFAHTDDAPNECFRKYKRAEDSYIDHSNYLSKTPRYANLFKLSVTDYAGWAFGLKQAGYATNPKYARVLIQIVEDYHLQEYTYDAMDNNLGSKYAIPTEVVPEHDAPAPAKPAASNFNQEGTPVIATLDAGTIVPATTAPAVTEPAALQPAAVEPTTVPGQSLDGITVSKNIVVTEDVDQHAPEAAVSMPPYGQPVKINGLKAVYARKGDMPLEYAIKNNLRYERLLEINEIDERPLPMDMFLYLERKNFRGVRPIHKVKEGETMFSIAQMEGVQIKSLRSMNMMQQGDEPEVGTLLELQKQATRKPAIVKKDVGQTAPPAPEATTEVVTIQDPVPAVPATTKTVEVDKNIPVPIQDTTHIENLQPIVETKPTPPPQEVVATGDKVSDAITKEAATVSAPAIETTPPTTSEIAVGKPAEANEKPEIVGPPSSPNDIPAKPIEKPKSIKQTATTQPVKQQQAEPAPEEPKTELDLLKSKFDKVVYTKPKPAENAAPKDEPKAEEQKTVQKETTASVTPKYYTVKKGDTAFSIAKANNITMRQLMDMNGLDFAEIKVGQKLRVQ